ncbi:MAG TPA: hypothetical protein VF164_07095 [Trueperaceae bacterium]
MVDPASFAAAARAALTLSMERLAVVPELPDASSAALLIVLLAGISEAAGESVVLFVNRVRPRRFFVSLAVSGLLFVFTYLFLSGSVIAVTRLLLGPDVRAFDMAIVVGAAFAPRMFGFLGFLPYFGQPIGALLQAWSVLAALRGVRAVLGAGVLEAIAAVALGALLLAVLQRTVGLPLVYVARRLLNASAGVRLTSIEEAVGLSGQEGGAPEE